MTVFAVYRADQAGPEDPDDGVCSTCVALFGKAEDAIAEARHYLVDGYSVSIDIGEMTEAEFDALEEVPDDFTFTPPPVVGSDRWKKNKTPAKKAPQRDATLRALVREAAWLLRNQESLGLGWWGHVKDWLRTAAPFVRSHR